MSTPTRNDDRPEQLVAGVNQRDYWLSPAHGRLEAAENVQRSEVLLVDATGRPLLTREPRPVGFRRP